MTTWQPTPLPEHLTRRGVSPDQVGQELLAIIEDAIANHPRTLQKRIGPSEIGNPCTRFLGYKLLEAPTFNYRVNWKAFVGTAMHEKLETVLDLWNLKHCAGPEWAGQERFYVEQKVTGGQLLGDDIDGSTDVYDRVTASVIDWKLVGPTKIKKYRRHGPGDQYRIQTHTYGRGWAARGLPVDHVMVVFLPRNGELRDTYVWGEPFNPQIAAEAFTRLTGVAHTTRTLGVKALDVLPTADAYCTFCDFFRLNSTDLTKGCPGDPAAMAPTPAIGLTGAPA